MTTTEAQAPSSPLLAHIPRDDLASMLREGKTRAFTAGQALFRRGDAPDGLYAIIAGDVRVTIEGPEGNAVVLATFGPGEMLGELSALDGTPRSATAVAATAVKAQHLTTAAFRSWLASHPAVSWAMLGEMAKRLRATDEQVAEIVLLSVEERIARRLWQRFAERSKGDVRPGSRLPLNQKELAATLGVTRESVNKHLARLKAAGTVELDGRSLVILRPDDLRAFSDVI